MPELIDPNTSKLAAASAIQGYFTQADLGIEAVLR